MVDVKELWCLDTADEGCKGGCEGAVVYRASSWWM